MRINVRHGDDLVWRRFVGRAEKAFHALSRADDSDAQRVIGAEDAGRSESGHSAGNDEASATDHQEASAVRDDGIKIHNGRKVERIRMILGVCS